MKIHLSIAAITLVALAGCQSSGGSSTPSPSPAPQVAGGGSMPDVCRAQASQQLGPSLENLSTNDPVTTGSGTTIRGSWQDPNTGDNVGTFLCQFNASGAFVSVKQI